MNRQCDRCGGLYDVSSTHDCMEPFNAAIDSARSELVEALKDAFPQLASSGDVVDAIEVLIQASVQAAEATKRFSDK